MDAVAWGLWPTPRFPSPLIELDVRISRIQLSDWFHREAHGKKRVVRVFCSARFSPSPHDTAFSDGARHLEVFVGSRQSPRPRRLRKAHQKSGPFPPPALPGLIGPTTLSDSRSGRRLARR